MVTYKPLAILQRHLDFVFIVVVALVIVEVVALHVLAAVAAAHHETAAAVARQAWPSRHTPAVTAIRFLQHWFSSIPYKRIFSDQKRRIWTIFNYFRFKPEVGIRKKKCHHLASNNIDVVKNSTSMRFE